MKRILGPIGGAAMTLVVIASPAHALLEWSVTGASAYKWAGYNTITLRDTRCDNNNVYFEYARSGTSSRYYNNGGCGSERDISLPVGSYKKGRVCVDDSGWNTCSAWKSW